MSDKDKTKKGSSPDFATDPTKLFSPSFTGGETGPVSSAPSEKLRPLLAVTAEQGKGDDEAASDPADGVKIQGKVVKRLGEYRILRELGHGGMGVVYEAVQESLGRHVALKVLPFHTLMDKSHLERFHREARAAAMLHHPNIVPVFGVGEQEGINYYAMQFIQGKGLDRVVEEVKALRSPAGPPGSHKEESIKKIEGSVTLGLLSGTFEPPSDPALGGRPSVSDTSEHAASDAATLPEAPAPAPKGPKHARACAPALSSTSADSTYYRSVARVGMQVARALAYANSSGILHRDIKPSNLLLDEHGTVWITDFGLAKAEGGDQITQTGDILGTLAFMAPERFEGWSDPRSDIFSLGLTLYELLALRPAFEDTDRRRLIKKLTEEDPVRPTKLDRRIPVDLETIVMKSVAKDPHQRYQTAALMAEDLDRFLREEPIHARPPSTAYHLKLFAKRQRRVLVAGGLGLLFSVIGFAAYSWHLESKGIRDNVEEANAKIHGDDLETAEDILVQLERTHRDHPDVIGLAHRLARNLLNRGKEHWKQFRLRKEQIGALETAYRSIKGKKEPSAPAWEREDEIQAWQGLEKARHETDERYQRAIFFYNKALGVVHRDFKEKSLILRALEEVNWERFQEARANDTVPLDPEYYWSQIESLGIGTYKTSKMILGSDPPGAEVYCFRYEEYEARLVPIPFHPGTGFRGDPYLEVEKIWSAELSPFQARDRLIQVGAERVRLEGDFAKALKTVGEGEAVEVTVLRQGKREVLQWVPVPKPKQEPPGEPQKNIRVASTRQQFGFTFAGYPLDLVAGARVGVTSAGSPLALTLPRGSYLLLLRKEGYVDARFPIAFPRESDLAETVRLLTESEIPPGFIYIPAGTFACGGDRGAFQALDPAEQRVEGFFMGRFEVTLGEYLDFMNDPTVHPKVPPDPGEPRLVPRDEKKLGDILVKDQETGQWTLAAANLKKDSPVLGIPQLAAIQYANWRSRKKGRGWKYRLPTDLEWEKAARGADRRLFVWGNYPVWSFCCGRRSAPTAVGSFPLDESVFGARDLGGSVSEDTSGEILDRGNRFVSRRGGNFYEPDELWIHAATRNGILADRSAVYDGFRLAAELKPAAN